MHKLPTVAAALLAAALALPAAPALAVADTYSEAHIYFGNEVSPFQTNVVTEAVVISSTGAVTATGDVTRGFSGLDHEGEPGSASFEGAAAAQAEYGSLRAEARYALDGAIANAANPKYVDENFVLNPQGVPTRYGAWAVAFFRDSLAVVADPGASYLQLSLRLSGDILSEGLASSFVTVRQNAGGGVFGGGFATLAFAWADGPYDLTVSSSPIPIVDGVAAFGLMLEAEAGVTVSPELIALFGGESAGTADFFSTLGILEIAAFAADDTPVELFSVTGDSGLQYPVAVIPEPAMAWMLLAGLLVLAAPRLRRRPSER